MVIALLRSRPCDGAPAKLAAVESILRPGRMTPLHVHRRDEAVQVLEGTVTVYRGGRGIELRGGDALVLPGGEPHAIQAGSVGARIRSASYVASVAGYGDFLRASATPSGGLRDDAATLAAIAAANGISVVGSPGALPAAAAA